MTDTANLSEIHCTDCTDYPCESCQSRIDAEHIYRIDQVLLAACPEWLTPSQVGRKAKMKTTTAAIMLNRMVKERFARSTGNGSWTKYACGRES